MTVMRYVSQPSATCPAIDRIKDMICVEGFDSEADYNKVLDLLEDLRQDNSDLRMYGWQEKERADELEKELSKANDTIYRLEADVKYLEAELNSIP